MDAVEFALRPVREDSTVLRVYNDGLTGFVYDRKHEAAIRRSGAALLHGIGRSVYDDRKSMALLAKGTLLLFGLHDDDSLAVEIAVGAPLTAEELAHGSWLESGPAWIDLPGGTLCLHSYNSLPMGDNEGAGTEPGASVQVPPGRYLARMYRKRFDAQDAGAIPIEQSTADSDRVVRDVLVLTPMPADAAPSPHNVLFGDCIDFIDPASRPQRIIDGVWRGRIGDLPDARTAAIDFTEDDAEAMGLRCGDRLVLRAGDVELPVFFFGERHVRANWGLAFGDADNAGLPRELAAEGHIGGGRLDWSAFHERRLELRAVGETHPFFSLPLHSEVTVQVDAAPYLPLPPPARYAKGVVQGEVVGSTGHGLLLSIDDKTFRKLRVEEGGCIEVEVGGHRFVAGQRPDARRMRSGVSENPAASRPVWAFVGYLAAKGQCLLGLQVAAAVRRLDEDAQRPYRLPLVPIGTPVTVRRHEASAEPA